MQSYKLRHLKKLLGLKKQAVTVHSVIRELAGLAATSNELDYFYLQLHEIIARLVKAPNLFIVFRNHLTQRLEIPYYATQNEPLKKPNLPDSVLEMGLTGYLLRQKSSLLCSYQDYQNLVEQGEIIELGQPANSWLGVYITRENGDPGVIALASYQSDVLFSEQDKLVLELISEHIIHAIDRVTYHAQMAREIGSRATAMRELREKIETEKRCKSKFVNINQAVFSVYEKYDLADQSENMYSCLSDLIQQQFSLPHYIVQCDKSSDEWQILSELRCKSIRSLATQRSLNQYLAMEPQPRVLEQKELNDLIKLQLIPEAMQSLKNFTLASAVLLNNSEQSVLLVMQAEDEEQSLSTDDYEVFSYLCFQLRLILKQWQAQQSVNQFEYYLKSQSDSSADHELKQQIVEHKRIQEQLYYDANHDLLTGLPNRQLFNRKLLHAVASCSMNEDSAFTVIFIDLDKFKLINDSFGSQVGDSFLLEASRRITEFVHEEDVLARLGGDEFVVLLNSCPTVEQAKQLAMQLIDRLNQCYQIEGRAIYASCSIGITSSEHGYQKPADVLRDADTAVYQAKKLGRGRYVVFDKQMHLQLIEQLTQEYDLRRVIKQGDIRYLYQPIVQLENNGVCSVEAQARWYHPDKGVVAPNNFFHLAEDRGLLQQLEFVMLEDAIEALSGKSLPTDINQLSVNLTSVTLLDNQSMVNLQSLLTLSTAVNKKLILVFDEMDVIQNIAAFLPALRKLRHYGVQVALDNFLTSGGSFQLLFSQQLDVLRLPAQLLKKAEKDTDLRTSIIESVAIAKRLDIQLVAVEVEHTELAANAAKLGIEYCQGQFLTGETPRSLRSDSKKNRHLSKSRKFAM
ncbi:EAL domain-containing protein [Gayadomonas joobiniege]|uniref:EAL domain-containing protein n=1 Tax=Gayadomonas joobiniege TaxID=1234606 RepID=UPI00036C158B|nr:EAL domain-containing protein [Gayadomonas joobiniege]